MKRSDEIRARLEAIRGDLESLEQIEESGQDEEQIEHARSRSDDLFTEYDELKAELEPLEAKERRMAEVREYARQRVNVEPGEPGEPVGQRSGPYGFTRDRNRDPYVDLDSVRQGITPPADVRARALAAIEQHAERSDHWALPHDGAERATELVQRMGIKFGTEVARQMLETGSPEYLQNFENYLNDPKGYAARAAMTLTGLNGGFLVPFTLDPSIILTNSGSANPYRQISTIKTTTTNDWNGVTSAGVTAEWTAEATEANDASPTFGQLKITPVKADAFLFGSYEVLSDSDFASQLPMLLADAKDRIEEAGFAVGTGTGQPFGMVTGGTSQTFAAGSLNNGPSTTDVFALMAALPARFRGPRANNVWLANLSTINILRTRALFTGATVPLLTDGPGGPQMLGKRVYESTSISGAQTSGSKVLVFADASQYYIVDRVGMSVLYDPMGVPGLNRRMPQGEGAWYAFWRVGANVATSNAVRVGADAAS